MDDKTKAAVAGSVRGFAGKAAIYYENLCSGDMICTNEHVPMLAASTIKLFIMAEAFRRFELDVSPDEVYRTRASDKVPSCGAVTYLHNGLELTLYDLVTLMIIVSDNTATNILMRRFGIDAVNEQIKRLGMNETVLRREMFDYESAKHGLQNYVSAADLGRFFRMLYRGEVVSPAASQKMIGILKNQQLNGKIPFILSSLPDDVEIAHKTGEDSGITHDAGIIFAGEPFVLCMCGNEVNVPEYERLIADTAYILYGAAR